jgi:hypothetical protein
MSGHRTKVLRRFLRTQRPWFTAAEWRTLKRAWTRTHRLPPLEG